MNSLRLCAGSAATTATLAIKRTFTRVAHSLASARGFPLQCALAEARSRPAVVPEGMSSKRSRARVKPLKNEAAVATPPLPAVFAAGTVFVAAGCVLVLEILAVRLLAPYVGLTLETTTSIIGAVLLGISVGAAIGGRVADRTHPGRRVVGLLIGGGLLALLTVPIVRWLGPSARGGGAGGGGTG